MASLDERVSAAAATVLKFHKRIDPLEVIVQLGWHHGFHEQRWRAREVDCLVVPVVHQAACGAGLVATLVRARGARAGGGPAARQHARASTVENLPRRTRRCRRRTNRRPRMVDAGRGTTCARRRLVGAKTPWKRVRFASVGGIRGTSLSSNSTPVITSCLRPSWSGRFTSTRASVSSIGAGMRSARRAAVRSGATTPRRRGRQRHTAATGLDGRWPSPAWRHATKALDKRRQRRAPSIAGKEHRLRGGRRRIERFKEVVNLAPALVVVVEESVQLQHQPSTGAHHAPPWCVSTRVAGRGCCPSPTAPG